MLNRKNNIYITDTFLIANKGGIDNIAYNPQLLKHKTSKVSIITNNVTETYKCYYIFW